MEIAHTACAFSLLILREGWLERGGKERKEGRWTCGLGTAFGQCRAPGGKELVRQLAQL